MRVALGVVVWVGVRVPVRVAVRVTVSVPVRVAVRVAVRDSVGVVVRVAVRVAVGTRGVRVRVGVASGLPMRRMMPRGPAQLSVVLCSFTSS